MKLLLVVTAAALITFGLGGYALAFHDGGVAHCDGCHTMHNSEDGASIIEGGTVGVAGDHLTLGADPSSTCLNCHAGSGTYHIFYDGTDPAGSINLTPGGDFYWMTKTFNYTTHRPHTAAASNHGHNIIAADYGLVQDDTLITAPGGTFPANGLYCSSCHDPHGKKANKAGPIEESGSYGADPTAVETGNYRLLGDVGYSPAVGVTFTKSPPIATTGSPFGPLRDETDVSHTDYGQNMSEWCSNCHTGFLPGATATTHVHPAGNSDTLGPASIDDNYNAYRATGDVGGTNSQTDAYLALVPFERGTDDPTVLDPTTQLGPDGNSNVMCLTCHRAHASAFPNAGRWDFETEFLVDSHPQDSDGGATAGDQLASYYGRNITTVFGPDQRSLCNKCHIQD
jgi:hypothetical protein